MAFKMRGNPMQRNFPDAFPSREVTSPHKGMWGNAWKNFKSGVKNFADKAEGYFEKASYLPVIGRVASGIDALKDSYDAYSAHKAGDMETYRKELADVAGNVAGVALGSGGKVLSAAIKQGGKTAAKQVAKHTAKKIAQKQAIGTGKTVALGEDTLAQKVIKDKKQKQTIGMGDLKPQDDIG